MRVEGSLDGQVIPTGNAVNTRAMRQHESWYHVRMRHPTRGVLKQGRLKGAIDKYFATPAIADGRI